MKSAQQQFQLRDVKRRRRTAAEVNRRWKKQGAARSPRCDRALSSSLQERLTKSRGLRAIQQIFVKRAIRTNPRAEGDVNVDVANCAYSYSTEWQASVAEPCHWRRFSTSPTG